VFQEKQSAANGYYHNILLCIHELMLKMQELSNPQIFAAAIPTLF